MNIKSIFISAVLILQLVFLSSSIANDDVQNTVQKILNQMTLSEKISQLSSDEPVPIERLGLHYYNWHNEALHGVVWTEATIFPQSIALAAGWDRNLMIQMASAISDEARILNRLTKNALGLNFWSPNVNMVRDPRW